MAVKRKLGRASPKDNTQPQLPSGREGGDTRQFFLAEAVVQLKRILYATDFSEASRLALPIVCAIGRKYGSQIWVMNVWSRLPYSMVTPEALGVVENKQEADAKAEMARFLQRSELQELPTKPLVVSGDPVEEISHFIDEQRIDLAVIATHGRTGLKHFLMGSLAEQLLHTLTCPILTVGPHLNSRFGDWKEIKTILYPTDFSPESKTVFPYVAALAAEYQSTIMVLHVVRPKDKGGPDECAKEILREQMRRSSFIHRLIQGARLTWLLKREIA